MKLRRTVSIVLCLVLASNTDSFAKDRKRSSKHLFKIATLAPDRSVWMNTFRSMADEILEATNSEVKFRCFPGGVQGDEATVLRKIRIGQLHGSGLTGTGLSLICKDSLVFQLPIVFRNQEEIDFVFPQMLPLFKAQCEASGFHVLGWPHLGFSYLFSTSDVRDISSLRSAKPWLLENDVISKVFFDTAGVSAVSADISDVLTGLRSGLIHTVFSPPVGMISLQWFSRINYRLDLKLIYSFGAFVVAKKKWNRIPKDMQQKIDEISQRHFAELNKKTHEQNQDALQVMERNRIQTVYASQQSLDKFEQISSKVANRLAGNTFSNESLSLLRSLLSEFRKRNSQDEQPVRKPAPKH